MHLNINHTKSLCIHEAKRILMAFNIRVKKEMTWECHNNGNVSASSTATNKIQLIKKFIFPEEKVAAKSFFHYSKNSKCIYIEKASFSATK